MSAENPERRERTKKEATRQGRQYNLPRKDTSPKEIVVKKMVAGARKLFGDRSAESLGPDLTTPLSDISEVVGKAREQAEKEFARDQLENDLEIITSAYPDVMHALAATVEEEVRKSNKSVVGDERDWRQRIGRLKPPHGFVLRKTTLLDPTGEPAEVGIWYQEPKKRESITHPLIFQQALSPHSHHEIIRVATDETGSVSCIELGFGVTETADGSIQPMLPPDIVTNLKELSPTIGETLEESYNAEKKWAARRDMRPATPHREYFSLIFDLSSINKRWTVAKEGSFLDLESEYVISQKTEKPQEEAAKYARLVTSVLDRISIG